MLGIRGGYNVGTTNSTRTNNFTFRRYYYFQNAALTIANNMRRSATSSRVVLWRQQPTPPNYRLTSSFNTIINDSTRNVNISNTRMSKRMMMVRTLSSTNSAMDTNRNSLVLPPVLVESEAQTAAATTTTTSSTRFTKPKKGRNNSSRKDSTNPSMSTTATPKSSRGGGNKASDHVWVKLFSDHFYRTNSTNALFVRQYYSLLKMERQLHKLCHHYLQSLQRPSQSSNTSSLGGSSTSIDKEVDLFLKLLHNKTNKTGTTTPVRITELPAPTKLLFLPNLMMPTAENNTHKIMLYASNYYSTEPLYQEIINLTNKVGISWCNISTTMVTSSAAAAASPSSSSSSSSSQSTSAASNSTSIGNPTSTDDDYYNTDDTSYYIPCNVMRAQNWVYAMEQFCSSRQGILQYILRGSTTTISDEHPSHHPTLTSGSSSILGKVTSFVRNVFATGGTSKDITPATAALENNSFDVSITADYPLRPLKEEEQVMADHPIHGPSSLLYQSLLMAYGKVYTARPHHSLTTRMEQLIAHMDSASSSNTYVPRPNFTMFILLMRHYGQVRSTSRSLAKRSDALLQRMDAEEAATPHQQRQHQPLELHLQNNALEINNDSTDDKIFTTTTTSSSTTTSSPTSTSFVNTVTTETIMLVMRAYSRVKQSMPSALRCEALLERMERAELDGHGHLAPTTEAYNLCLRAFLKVNPTSRGDHTTITSYVERILSRMEARRRQGILAGAPNTMTYNLAIAIFSASSQKKDYEKALSWIEYLERESCLRRRQQDQEEEESTDGTMMGPPSTFAYNSYLLSTLARIKEQTEEDEVKGDNVIETVERLYNNMVSHGVSKPDYTTFDTLFQIYRHHRGLIDAGERAEALLSRMEVQYATGSNNIVKPDARMYVYAIKCWANAAASQGSAVNASVRAYTILKNMDLQASIGNNELKPNEPSYSAVIHVCSCTTQSEYQPVALRIAFECYNNMISQGNQPSAITYSCLLKCCATLVHDPKQRDKLARQVFGAACEQGQVNEIVESTLRRASGKLYKLYQKHDNKKEHSARVSKGLLVGSISSSNAYASAKVRGKGEVMI